MDVAAIGEHAADAMEFPIYGPRKARGNCLKPARQVPRATGLDDQMHVIALDRIMNETKSAALARLAPASLQLGHQIRNSERGNVLPHLERDMTWMTRCQRCSPPVRIASRRPRLEPRAGPRAAPTRRRLELELKLSRSQRHTRESRTAMCQMRSVQLTLLSLNFAMFVIACTRLNTRGSILIHR